MNADDPRAKWHLIDADAAREIASCSSSPGVIFPIGTTALPTQLQRVQGAVSYYVSAYSSSVSFGNNTYAGGEMAVVRTDGDLAKAYNFVFASSNNGLVYFNGPHYNFPEHHFASSAPVPIEALFGHIPAGTRSSL